MATALRDSCSVCTDDYDSGHRQSAALRCGHDICLSCLVRLRSRGKHKCPTCRHNWTMMALPIPPEMEALAAALGPDQEEEEDDGGKKNNADDRSKKHLMPYDFWVNDKNEFYCKKCAAEETSHVKLDIIDDAIPLIKAGLAADVTKTKMMVKDDLKSLDEKHSYLLIKRNSAIKFMKAVEALKESFDKKIKQVAAQKANTLDTSVEMTKMEKKITNIKTPADLGIVMDCKNTLKKVGAPSSVPASDLPQTLLGDIACSYEVTCDHQTQ